MTHVLGLLAALFVSTSTMAIAPHENPSEYLVVERIDGADAILESKGGSFRLPVSMLPMGAGEGMVLEWNVAQGETNRRLADAQARIERMQKMSIAEI